MQSEGPDTWILLNRDYSWEEIVVNNMDMLYTDEEFDLVSSIHPRIPRPFSSARLSDVCRDFRTSLDRMDSHLQVICMGLRDFDDTRLARCHKPVHDTLHKHCASSLRLFLAGSEGDMKRSLVKEILGLDPRSCPYSDRVTVWYHSSNGGPLCVLIHFRQNLADEELSSDRLHPSIRDHLASHGPSFPFRARDMAELEAALGCSGRSGSTLGCSEAGWEDVSTCLHIVDSLEAFIAGSELLDAGLDVIDGSTVAGADVVSTALRWQADCLLFIDDVDSDPPFDWWPVQQALQYFERESVFVVAAGEGREDGAGLDAARSRALELGVPRGGVHVLAAAASTPAVAERQVLGLESALAEYLEARAAGRALRLSRQVSKLVEMLQHKADNWASLLGRPQSEARALRTSWTPKLLAMQDQHEAALREVRLENNRQKDRIQREAEDFFRRLADELLEAASRLKLSRPVGLKGAAGAFQAPAREEYAREAEAALVRWLEEETDRWTAMHLLPLCERAAAAVEQALGDQAREHPREVRDGDGEDLLAVVSNRVRQAAAAAATRRLPPPAAGLPALGARLAACVGAANGCRSLLPAAALAGGAAASYGLLAVGALGGGLGSWLAFRSAGAEAEAQIRRCVAEEMAGEVRRRAAETAAGISSALMHPCVNRIDAYEAYFRGELRQFAGAMDDAEALLQGGQSYVAPRLVRCQRFRRQLEELQATLRSEQFELLRLLR